MCVSFARSITNSSTRPTSNLNLPFLLSPFRISLEKLASSIDEKRYEEMYTCFFKFLFVNDEGGKVSGRNWSDKAL